MFALTDITCGDITIDIIVPNTVHLVVTIIKILIPIALIVWGLLDLGKAVMANEEKEMKEAQGKFIKRCLYAVLVFFVVAVVQFVFKTLAKADEGDENKASNATTCIACFINGDC